MSIRPDVVKRGDNHALFYRANADLTGATSIRWIARTSPNAVGMMEVPATLEDVDEQGQSLLRVDLTETQTAAAGQWLVEIEAVIAARRYTFPSDGYLRLRITEDLD